MDAADVYSHQRRCTLLLCIRMRVRLFLPAEKQGRGEKSAFALGLVKIFFVLLVFFTF